MEEKPKYTIINNEKNLRFEIREDDDVAFLEYRFNKGAITLMHTLVPRSLSGKGLGSALAKHAFDYAAERHLEVIVYCPFVKKFLQTHPAYWPLLKKD